MSWPPPIYLSIVGLISTQVQNFLNDCLMGMDFSYYLNMEIYNVENLCRCPNQVITETLNDFTPKVQLRSRQSPKWFTSTIGINMCYDSTSATSSLEKAIHLQSVLWLHFHWLSIYIAFTRRYAQQSVILLCLRERCSRHLNNWTYLKQREWMASARWCWSTACWLNTNPFTTYSAYVIPSITYILQEWKLPKIILVHKSGDWELVKNYRPTSLLCTHD